jgi:PTH1 family peptidyl-tRNA hydrolase
MPFWRGKGEEEVIPGLKLVVGLGNPGSQYSFTRHNVGFMVLDRLAERLGARFKSSRQRAQIARGSIAGTSVLLALPVTYMNESGNAVIRLLQYFHIERSDLIVVCDDMDLPFGTIRIRPSGSAGGQNGLKSIIQAIGSDEFTRVRLGVGRPASGAVPHVLGKFPSEEQRRLPALLDVAADAVTAIVSGGVTVAMNEYNRDWLPELSR